MKMKKSVFMLMVMLMGTITQLVTGISTIQAFAEETSQDMTTMVKNENLLTEGTKPEVKTQTEQSSIKEPETVITDSSEVSKTIETQESVSEEVKESGLEKEEEPEKLTRSGGQDITTLEKAGLLPKDKNGNPTILTSVNMTLNGNEITEVNPLRIGDEFQINYTFVIPDEFGKTMVDGDYFQFKLPQSEVITLTQRQEGDLIDPDNGLVYGRYYGETNGDVKMVFNDKVSKNDDVDGNLMFSMRADEKHITIPGDYEVEIPGVITDESQIITIAGKYKSYIQKEYLGSEGRTHKWKVLLNPNYLKINGFALKDKTVLVKGNKDIAESINIDRMKKAKVDLQGNITEGQEVSVANKTFDSKGNIDLGFDYIEEPYVVYLSTPIPSLAGGTLRNTATLVGNVGPNYITEEASAETNLGKVNLIHKEVGSYNKKDQTIDWTVTYNPDGIHIDQKDAYFKDILTNGTLIEDSMTVSPNLPHEVKVAGDKKEFDFIFKTDVDEPVVIKYKSKVINPNERFAVNKVIALDDEKQVSKDLESDGGTGEGGEGDGTSSIVKSKPTEYQGAVTWELNINKEKQKVDKWWVTDQVDTGSIRQNSFKLTNMSTGGEVPKSDYELEWHTDKDNVTKGFTVKYNKATSDYFKITYVTDYERNTNQKNNAEYHYVVEGNEKEDDDSQTFVPKPSEEIGLSKSGRFIPEDNEIEWTVMINEKSKVALGPDNLMRDPIMSDQDYVDGSAKAYYKYGVDWKELVSAETKYDQSKNELQVTHFMETNYAHKVVFRTKLKNPLDIVSKTIKNTAYYQDKYTKEKAATATLEGNIGNELFVKKDGKVNATDPSLIDWQVDVNPHGYHLRDLEIIDNSWENQIVIRETIALRDSKGSRLLEGIDYTLDYTERYFHIKMLHDVNEKLDLTYQGRIVFPNGTIPGSSQQVKNSIKISAKGVYTTEKPIDVKIPVTVPNSSGTIQGKTRNLNVRKVSEEDPNQRLSGAEFVLYRGTEKDPGKVVNRVTTDGSGNALFDKLTKGDYLLVETKAPNGYDISAELKNGRIVKIEDDKTTTIEEVVSNPKEGTTPEKEKIDIPVEKKWQNVPAAIETPEVTVRLFANGDEIDSMKLNKNNSYKGVFKDLPKEENGKDITYTLKEDSVPNYDSNVTGSTITNTYNNSEKTKVTGEKIWKDDNNAANKRPDKVTIELLQDGEHYDQKDVYQTNNWKYEFNNLPKIDNKTGKEYVYTVKEMNVSNDYESEVDGYNIINTLVKVDDEKIKIKGEKKWQDKNNQAGNRPDAVEVILFQNDSKYLTTEAKAINNWRYEFVDLPKTDDNGKDFTYTVKEGKIPDGYESDVNGYTITNRYTKEEVVSFSGEKRWEGDKPENRPNSVEIQLYQDDKPYQKQTATKSNNWKYEFTDLPKYDEKGYLYRYRVEEANTPDGYFSNVDGNNITNTYSVKEMTEFKGEKLWKDSDNSLKTRPDSIIVYLYQNEGYKPFDTKVVVPVGNRWEYTFTNLPKYDDKGELYRYSVKEEEVRGYETSNTGNNDLTNTYKNNEKTSISGKKEWEDNGNQDKTRPSSITVHLLKNGKRVDKQVVTGTNDWKYTFSNLDKYDENLNLYKYTVEEEDVDGYTSEVSGTTIKNTLIKNELIDISGEKFWKGDENSSNARPNGVYVNLYQNGINIDKQFVRGDREGRWKYTFSDLPLKDGNGKEYKYTVKESSVPAGYVSKVTGYDITNTFDNSSVINIEGKKHWIDMGGKLGAPNPERPSSLSIELQRRSSDMNFWMPVSYYTARPASWDYAFYNLPKYDPNGNLYEYRVDENKVPTGYKKEILGYDIVNTLLVFPTIDIKATKTWDDNNNQANLRPESITVYLLQDGKVIKTEEVRADANSANSSNWEVVFKGLYEYDKTTGKKHVYTVKEEAVPNYETTYPSNNNSTDLEIKNTFAPNEKLDIKGEKIWNDSNNAFSKRPETVNVDLYQDNIKIDTAKTDKTKNWRYEFMNLPKYTKDGNKHEYRVEEEKVPLGYESEVLGFDIVNTYQNNDVIDVTGTKVWDDYNNKFETRPESVTVNLYQNDKKIDDQKLDKNNNWTYQFKNLKKYDDTGIEYVYHVKETNVPKGYQSIVEGNTITNKYRNNQKTKLTGEKRWIDYDNKFKSRPKSIEVILLKDGNEFQKKTVKPDETGNWSYEFNNLDKYNELGDEIKYTVKEVPVDEYETEIVGNTIFNTFVNKETTKISVVKKWVAGSPDEKRPEKVNVILLKDGKKFKNQDLNEKNNWSHTFDDLEKYDDNGEEYEYQVVEEGIPNYITTYENKDDIVTITNTYDISTEKTSISGLKIWDDYNGEVKPRPNVVTIGLYQGKNQEKVLDEKGNHVTTTTNEANGWSYKFTGLQKYDENKNLIEYSVKELEFDPEYTSTVQGTNITNNYRNKETIDIDGYKRWNDYNNAFGIRPEEITVHLLQDGKIKDSKIAKKDSDDPDKSYRFEFNGLPKYDEHGKLYKYEVMEEVEEPYTWKSEMKEVGKNKYEVTLENTYKNTEKTSLSGEKKWDDYENYFDTRPESITVQLYKVEDGKEVYIKSAPVKENQVTRKWTYEFTDLAKYNENGDEIIYIVKESVLNEEDGYKTEIDGNEITNRYVNNEIVEFRGEKKWDDYNDQFKTRPKEVTIYLLRNNKKIDETKTDETKNWKYDFGKKYPVYDDKGNPYKYRVLEKDVLGYTTTITESKQSTKKVKDYTVNNSYVNTEKTRLEGNKTWDDFDGKIGGRPEKLTVTLFKNIKGQEPVSTNQTKVLTKENNWTYVFEDLPVYDKDGNKYIYTAQEDNIDGYEQTNGGPYFVNRSKKIDELTLIEGEKIWHDENNALGKRPEKIEVVLYQNGNVMTDSNGNVMTQETSFQQFWKYRFDKLPKYDNQGDEYKYTVKEKDVEEYDSFVIGNNIENTYQNNETINLNGKKTWDDAGNKLESRPDSIKVELYQNDNETPYQVEEVKPNDVGDWKYEFKDLPKYDDQLKEYKYTIKEVNVPNYESKVEGMNITNHYKNDEKTKVEGEKVWFDKNNTLNKRPDEITVELFQNGGETPYAVQKIKSDKEGNWTYKFDDLPKYDDSLTPYVYTVNEISVEGYETSISASNGTTITNTLINDEKTTFKVIKKWEDHNNKLDTRPGSIRLNLYQNDGKIPFKTQKVLPDESGNWSYEFKDLPKYDANLNPYKYSVREMKVSNYTANTEADGPQGSIITNTYQNNETTEINGDKAWLKDANNKLDTRPESITVDLYQSENATEVYQSQEVKPDDEGNWSYSFKDLPKYDENLEAYDYIVKERPVKGYESVVEGTDIINTYQNAELTKLVGEKKWEDLDNKLNKRPSTIKVDLYQNNIKKQTQEVTADENGDWKYEFKDLPKYKDDTLEEHVYTVKEQKVDGYQTEIEGTTITNYYHNDEKTEVDGKKVWLDKDDKLNTRPSVIEVELYQNGGKKPFRTQFVKSNGTNEWTYQFINLPKYDEKLVPYEYTVKEKNVKNYSSVIKDTTITNTYDNNEVVGVKGKKIWDDKDNKLNVRPGTIYIDLYQNDSDTPMATEKVEADEAGNWEYEFVNLPKYDDNLELYNYQVSERKVDHYDTEQTGLDFTNTYRNDDKVEVNGEKKWNDFDNKLKKRPKRIKVDLYQNDSQTPMATKNVKANIDGDWKYSFKDLPKYDENLDEYQYTVKEQDVTNYDSKVEGTTITNTYQNKDITKISGEKIWSDFNNKLLSRPESITVYLHQNGNEVPMAEQKVEPGEDNRWTYEFKDLPKYDAELNEYHYTVSEKIVPHYNTVIDDTTITNYYRNDDKVAIDGKKVWKDEDNKLNLRPKSIKVELYQNGGTKPIAIQTVKSGKDGNWAYVFKNLPKYDEELNEYVYSVKEQDVSGYEGSIEGTTITNTYINNQTTEISGEKKWHDKDNKLKVRPKTIEVELYQNDDKVPFKTQTVKPNQAGDWNYLFTDLPKHDKQLNEYVYTVKEKEVAHYDSKVEGNNITNTYRNDETTEVAGKKKWVDEGNKINSRPESIQVELYQNNGKEAFKTQTVKPDKTGNWSYVFKDLPKYDDNYDKYTYTVKEQSVPHYETSIEGSNITNTYQNNELTDINGQKQWNDEGDKLSKRPESITVDLYQNDRKKETQVVKAGEDGQWKYTFKDLPKYDEKLNEYRYTVKEHDVKDYATVIEGTTIINTYKNVETTKLVGEKKWNDFDNKINSRPESITVELYQNNGKEPFREQIVTPDKNGHWNYSFEALPKYDNDLVAYTYTVKEQNVLHYESKVEGTTITNTYRNDEKTSIKGEKLWNDLDNKLNSRPDSITVELYQNGGKEPIEKKRIKPDKDGNWYYEFPDLVKYDENLDEYQYTVKEKKVDNYESKVEGTTITNTYQTEETTVIVEKKWHDDNDKLKVRPTEIEVDLYQNGKVIDTQKLEADVSGNWKHEFKNLPKYDEKLNLYHYSVKEQDVAHYESSIETIDNKHVITNTYQNNQTTNIVGKKLWNDSNNKAGLRPKSITVAVYQNDSQVAFKTEKVTPDALGNWDIKFNDLPKYDDKLNEYKYTLKEVGVKNYTSKVEGTTITNTLNKKTVPGGKIKPGTKTGGGKYLPKTGETIESSLLKVIMGMSLISLVGASALFRRKQ